MQPLHRTAAPLWAALRGCAVSLEASCSGAGGSRAYSLHVEPVAPPVTSQDVAEDWFMRQRRLITLGNRTPHVAVTAWVAPSAVVAGDVDIGDRASIWNGAVLRGDLNNITIGRVSNVQDGCVIHAARSSPTGLTAATLIGQYVSIEPNSVLRSARVQDFCIIGARSVLLEGSMMEPYSRLAPGSVLPPARRIPAGELWGGNPARFIKKLNEDDMEAAKELGDQIKTLAYTLQSNELPHGTAWRHVEEWRKQMEEAGGLVYVDLRRAKYQVRKEEEEAAKAREV